MKKPKIIPIIIAGLLTINTLCAQKSGFSQNNIGKMISLYLDIKNALINDDGTTAKIKANDLYYILSTQPDKGLQWRQCRVLADNLQPLLDNTREIGYTVSENEQRHYFAGLTTGMYGLLKGLKLNTSKIYMQYCPLNKAYWLSETPVIKNPYYNYDGWSKIGKTTEVLAAR